MSPFQGLGFVITVTQGGAARLAPLRSALGWCVEAPSGRELVPSFGPGGPSHSRSDEIGYSNSSPSTMRTGSAEIRLPHLDARRRSEAGPPASDLLVPANNV